MDRLAEVVEFRERLVAYMSLILEARANSSAPYSSGFQGSVLTRLRAEQPWLSTTYGRLYQDINPTGVPPRMGIGYGTIITSHDVIADAIHKPDDDDYSVLARLSDQHLMMRIGQMQREHSPLSADTFYRLTNPLYWLGRLWALLRWLGGSWSRRIATIIAAITLAIITGIATGWAQAIFTKP